MSLMDSVHGLLVGINTVVLPNIMEKFLVCLGKGSSAIDEYKINLESRLALVRCVVLV